MSVKDYTDAAERFCHGDKPIHCYSKVFVGSRDVGKVPEFMSCSLHGDFKLKVSKAGFNDKCMINSICPECAKEFRGKVDTKATELRLKAEQELALKEYRKRIEKLGMFGVTKRHQDSSFDNYITKIKGQKVALESSLSLCDSIYKKESAFNLIFTGSLGTGKTHLASAMVSYFIDTEFNARRVNLINLIRELKSTWSKDSSISELELISKYSELDLLVIDEVGIQFGSDTEKLFIFDIINGRYENKLPTVIISNLDMEGVKGVLGERCIDRLREDGGKVVAFTWESSRASKG